MSGLARVLRVGLLAFSCVLLVGHSLLFNFVTDDAFISFVYAKNLAQHGELVFNLGERVEGYTNFLWTLVLAAGLRLNLPPEGLSRVLGTLCALFTMLYSASLFRRVASTKHAVWESLSALCLATIPGYACWASGGLETQLFTLLCTVSLGEYVQITIDETAATQTGFARLGLTLGLASITRPEGYLLFALLAIHRLFHNVKKRAFFPTRLDWILVFLFLAITIPHMAFRRLYYGYFVPNTFYIKSSGGKGTWDQGFYYLWAFSRDLKLWIFPLLYGLGLLRAWSKSDNKPARLSTGYARLGELLLWWSVPFCLYVASVGGDFMGLYRFMMPIVPLWVFCGVLGLYRLLHELNARLMYAAIGVLLGLHGLNTFFVDRHALTFIGADRGIDTPGYLRHYVNDRIAIGKWFRQHVKPDDYQVVGGAGAQVYYAGIRALDSFGLSDACVAHEVPASSNRPGHQKFAPLEYVLSRKPTILTYNVYRIAQTPYRPSDSEAAMWRARGFHYVSVEIPGLSERWYSFLKRTDRSLGPFPPAQD
jgi:hypothetical protein